MWDKQVMTKPNTERARELADWWDKWDDPPYPEMRRMLRALADEVDELRKFKREVDEPTKRIDEKLTRTKENFEALATRKLELDKEVAHLREENEKRNLESERLWHALSQTFALVPPKRARLCEGAKWMFENYRERYEEVSE